MESGEFKFPIGGDEYAIPLLDSFDMDEAQILWDYCGFGIEALRPDQEDGTYSSERIEEVGTIMVSPPYLRTLLHVAYRRGNRQASKKEIEATIGRAPFLQILEQWSALLTSDTEDDDASPPAVSQLTSEPPGSSPKSSGDSSASSGSGSSTTTDAPAETPAPTGPSPLDTSSQESGLVRLAGSRP